MTSQTRDTGGLPRPGRQAIGAATFLFAALMSAPLLAQETPGANPDWLNMGSAEFFGAAVRPLVLLFVLAVLIESALSVIFNWRLFLQFFYGRGVRTLVMIAVSALVVASFHIDVVGEMMRTYGVVDGGAEAGQGALSFWLTALVLAGGSAGVYNILVALGYRQARAEEVASPKPVKGKAWVSIRVVREAARGDILVSFTPDPTVPAEPIAGVIAPRNLWHRFWTVFLPDPDRFPPSAGYAVLPDTTYRIALRWRDDQGQPQSRALDGAYAFADGAIVDLEVKL